MAEIKLLVIADAPLSNTLFDQVMFEVVGADRGDIVLMYPNDGDSLDLTKKNRDDFFKNITEFVTENKPKCVLALGEFGLYMTTNSKNIEKKRGIIQTVELEESKMHIVPTYSNFEVEKNNRFINVWAKDILKAYNIAMDRVSSVSPTKMVYCDTFEKIKQLVKYVRQTKMAIFDFETVEINADKGTFDEDFYATVLSFSFQAGSGYVIPLEHFESPFTKEEVRGRIMPYLAKYIFSDPTIRKVAHNLNFDAHVCRTYGVRLRGRLDDTMLMHHLYDETKRHGLKGIIEELYPEYAGYDDDLKGFKWADIPIKILSQYGATDTDMTYRLLVALESYLLEDTKLYKIYRNLTMFAFKALFEAESRGMDIDSQFLATAIKEVKMLVSRQQQRLKGNRIVKRFEDYNSRLAIDEAIDNVQIKLEKRIKQSEDLAKKKNATYVVTKTELNFIEKLADLKAGVEVPYKGINFGSWQQLEDLLYDSPEGFEFSALERGTGKDIIKKLPDRTGFVDGLLSFRSLKKTLSTYLEGIYRRLDKNDRVHTSFKLHGTVTGRLSSANPNLQNMPNTAKLRDETLIHAVGLVKKSFNVPKYYTMAQYDYSQAELRIIADFAGEDNMLDVYKEDGDIHAKTASEMIEVSLEEFYKLEKASQKEARQKAKAVNFGLIYDMSAEGFKEYAENQYGLILTIEEARETKDTFFRTYPKLLDYHEIYKAKASKFGHVRTLYGRKRRTPDINEEDGFKSGMDERAAINSPIQGTAGEFTVFAIALLRIRLDPRIIFVNTIHDSIIFYIPNDLLNYAHKEIKYTMENLPNKQYFGAELKSIGMKVDVEISTESWKDLQEIDT